MLLKHIFFSLCHGPRFSVSLSCSVFVLQVHTTAEDADGLDDVENSLLCYNQAIIHYYLRQFSEAISIGERLYQFLEPFGGLEYRYLDYTWGDQLLV